MSTAGIDTSGQSTRQFIQYHDRIVIVDEDRARAQTIRQILEFLEYPTEVLCAGDWRAATESGDNLAFLVGACESKTQYLRFIQEVRAWDPTVPVYVLGDQSTDVGPREDTNGQFLRHLRYPLRINHLHNELELGRLYRENRRQKRLARSDPLFQRMVGKSQAMETVRQLITQVARTDATVLIRGETGTGKEIAARNIHCHSPRRGQPFVAVNCGAIPADLLESELFGHEKGAFTGAIAARQGRFELANGGTLFLDEIGDMPVAMQVKLLRVLQERTFERVGSTRSQRVDVRVIAATHRDLEHEISAGRFREDLFYRLNVFPIDLPPLRERIADLPLLASELVARLESAKQNSVRLTDGALAAISAYDWPGNVRELANFVERLSILHPFGVVDVHHLPARFRPETDAALPGPAVDRAAVDGDPDHVVRGTAVPAPFLCLSKGGVDLRQHLYDLERTFICQAIEQTEGVVAHAAKLLGMRRTTLVEKMRKFGISRPGEELSEA